MKVSAFIATSVDGYIARENGGIDWLSGRGNSGSGEDYGYREFIRSVDGIVMGRNTYEKVLSFGSWPYGKKPVFVLSTEKLEIPKNIAKTVSQMSAPPKEIVTDLAKEGYKHLYVDGGRTIQDFLKAGLIQQMIITMVPILIGSGIPLFGSLPHDVRLRSLKTRQFDDGLVQCKYQVIGAG
jgi:dihydrofolate reductase